MDKFRKAVKWADQKSDKNSKDAAGESKLRGPPPTAFKHQTQGMTKAPGSRRSSATTHHSGYLPASTHGTHAPSGLGRRSSVAHSTRRPSTSHTQGHHPSNFGTKPPTTRPPTSNGHNSQMPLTRHTSHKGQPITGRRSSVNQPNIGGAGPLTVREREVSRMEHNVGRRSIASAQRQVDRSDLHGWEVVQVGGPPIPGCLRVWFDDE